MHFKSFHIDDNFFQNNTCWYLATFILNYEEKMKNENLEKSPLAHENRGGVRNMLKIKQLKIRQK